MPLYEYECPTCEKTIELLVRGGESEKPNCPDCGNDNIAKVFSVPAAHTAGGLATGGSDLPISGEDCGAPGGCCGGMCDL